jgi:hypothetical protein
METQGEFLTGLSSIAAADQSMINEKTHVAHDPLTAESPDQIGRKIKYERSERRVRDLYNDWKLENVLDPCPHFQRKYVWKQKQAALLVESILMNIPIPLIYTTESPDGKELVIDGQQRLLSLFRFIDNEYRLSGLQVFSNLNGKSYKSLDHVYQRKIATYPLPIVKISQPPDSDEEVKFDVFARINSGAVNLNEQEIRNCIYRGYYNDFLKDIAQEKLLIEMACTSTGAERMENVEMVLRFFAYCHEGVGNSYPDRFRTFLNQHMRKYTEYFAAMDEREREDAFDQWKKSFRQSLELSHTIFGKQAFKVCGFKEKEPQKLVWYGNVNKALYDVIMWGFSRHEKFHIIKHSDAIREALINFILKDQKFFPAYSRTRRSSVQYRFGRWGTELEAIITSPKHPRSFSYALKEELFERSQACALCGQHMWTLDDTEIDHIEPYWRGGETVPDNAQLVHRFCNRSKGAR